MARRQSIGQIRVWFVASIPNIAAPVAATINAGVDLTPQMRRDGFKAPRSPNMVDASDASDLNDKQSTGTRGVGPLVYTAYRDDVTDTAWTTLTENLAGFIVVRRFGGSTVAAAAGHKVEVYPVEVSSRAPADIAENENQRFDATLAVTGAADMNATVV